VDALEATVQRLREQERERLQAIDDPDSHPLWP